MNHDRGVWRVRCSDELWLGEGRGGYDEYGALMNDGSQGITVVV